MFSSDPHSDSHLPPNDSDPEMADDDWVPDGDVDFDQWLDTLQQSDRSFYNLMAMEVWSIAKTMDGLLPGFWSRFMSHRQVALKQFMEQKQSGHPENSEPPSAPDP